MAALKPVHSLSIAMAITIAMALILLAFSADYEELPILKGPKNYIGTRRIKIDVEGMDDLARFCVEEAKKRGMADQNLVFEEVVAAERQLKVVSVHFYLKIAAREGNLPPSMYDADVIVDRWSRDLMSFNHANQSEEL